MKRNLTVFNIETAPWSSFASLCLAVYIFNAKTLIRKLLKGTVNENQVVLRWNKDPDLFFE
jgi:hypothetical protein